MLCFQYFPNLKICRNIIALIKIWCYNLLTCYMQIILERTNAIMKKTRNLFVLTGNKQDIEIALKHIQFKGVTVLTDNELTPDAVSKVFANNKSLVCTQFPTCDTHPIKISVINAEISIPKYDCINISIGNIEEQFENIANKHNCDIGDHKSNSSGLSNAPSQKDCAYCIYLQNEHHRTEKSIYSSDHFFVMTTLGEFISGYWLIIPYEHVMSNAELDFSIQKELLTVIEDMCYLLNLTYGNCNYLIWENGTGNSGKGKAKDSVVHAHTHIAPSNLTAEEIEKLSGFNFEKISTEEISKYNQHSYLLLKDTSNMWRICNNPNMYIPRQYVRQLIADEYGIPGKQWNWRKYPYEEKMVQSYFDMAEAIIKNWDSLPDRIKMRTQKHINL